MLLGFLGSPSGKPFIDFLVKFLTFMREYGLIGTPCLFPFEIFPI